MAQARALSSVSAVRRARDDWQTAARVITTTLDQVNGEANWGDDEITALWERSSDPASSITHAFRIASDAVLKLNQTATVGPLPTPDRLGKRGTIPGRTPAQCDQVRDFAEQTCDAIGSHPLADALGLDGWHDVEQAFGPVGITQVRAERKRWQLASAIVATKVSLTREHRWTDDIAQGVSKRLQSSGLGITADDALADADAFAAAGSHAESESAWG